MSVFSQWTNALANPWANKNNIINMALPGTAIGNAALQRNEDQASASVNANEAGVAQMTQNPDGTYNENAADGLFGPRYVASGMIEGMSKDFYNEADAYSGISLKKDLEAMTTYGGNKGVLGQLDSAYTERNNANFASMGGVDGLGGQAGRTLAGYGAQQSQEAQQQQQSDFTRNKTLGQIDGLNRNRLYQNDLNKQLMSGLNVAPKALGA